MGMVDCVGKELNIGDKVICADSRYADLLIGEVVKLTPKKAWVRYHRSEYGKQYTNEKLKESYQIFKYVEVDKYKALLDMYHELRENFIDYYCSGTQNVAPYCLNKCEECVDKWGYCKQYSDYCKGFNPAEVII